MKQVYFPAGIQFRALAPLRADFVGMSDYFPAEGRNITACLDGLNAELFATFRSDKKVVVDAGAFGEAEMNLSDIYTADFGPADSMVFRALRLYPSHQLCSGVNIHVDCQYGAGGLSTSSSVAAPVAPRHSRQLRSDSTHSESWREPLERAAPASG